MLFTTSLGTYSIDYLLWGELSLSFKWWLISNIPLALNICLGSVIWLTRVVLKKVPTWNYSQDLWIIFSFGVNCPFHLRCSLFTTYQKNVHSLLVLLVWAQIPPVWLLRTALRMVRWQHLCSRHTRHCSLFDSEVSPTHALFEHNRSRLKCWVTIYTYSLCSPSEHGIIDVKTEEAESIFFCHREKYKNFLSQTHIT